MKKDNIKSESAEFIRETHRKARSSFSFTAIIAVIVLSIEGGYLYYLYSKIDSGLKDFEFDKTVGEYRKEYYLDEALKQADSIKEWRQHKDKIIMAEKVLDIVNLANAQTDEEYDKLAELIASKVKVEIENNENLVTIEAKKYINQEIDELPEAAKNEMVKHGARIRHDVNAWVTMFCASTSEEFGHTFDTFLNEHSDSIKEFAEAADDEDALDKLDDELTENLVQMIENTPIEKLGNLKEQSDKFLARVEAANERLSPLAKLETKQLSPQQLRLRRAVALFMDKVQNSNATVEPVKPDNN